ncbi:putative transmembrane anti-sigma factor [Burkholderia sp. 8Y]|uniref:anti-sigma factor family protein n=1 Tax=Burkholderia sp. 8Y TaxID=2653133 RepID=UPI0012F154F2|nr:anti-sigma factor [Burkholderia sp. 8Y]VXC74584.1 putative transmembrane anti-sigma factor [Burkholderia sp. 8Y]
MDNNDTASLESRLTDGSLYHHAPAHLPAQVLARVREEAAREERRLSQSRSRRNTWHLPFAAPWPFFGGAFAGATLSAVVLGAVLWMQTAAHIPADSPIAQEIVSSHVRSLMSDRPIDVLSSDKHTVKPWFNGRIDYAPPVIDPAGPGFALVGGRLDYIGHRPVAVVVYRYLKHPIDVYVFPDKTSAVPQKDAKAIVTRSDDGYALARWSDQGMTFWAVTDASAAVLHQFVQAIEAGTPR